MGAVLLAAGLGGCMTAAPRPDDGVYTIGGTARALSFQCSQETVASLGYSLVSIDGGEQVLRAERRSDSQAESWRGYLTVVVAKEPAGPYLYVSAERIADASRLPIGTSPAPQPTPRPTPVPRARAPMPRRTSPGPVASDARNVVRRCSMNGGSSLTSL
jgi:hypothetical protein